MARLTSKMCIFTLQPTVKCHRPIIEIEPKCACSMDTCDGIEIDCIKRFAIKLTRCSIALFCAANSFDSRFFFSLLHNVRFGSRLECQHSDRITDVSMFKSNFEPVSIRIANKTNIFFVLDR